MIINTMAKEKIGEKKTQELLKEMEGEDIKMLENVSIMIDKEMNVARRKGIREGRQEGMKEGIKEGIRQGIQSVVVMMLQKGMKSKEIEELTGIKKEEIEEAKNKLIM